MAFATRAKNVGSTSKDKAVPTAGPSGVPRASPLFDTGTLGTFEQLVAAT